jgi:hypothetical protein
LKNSWKFVHEYVNEAKKLISIDSSRFLEKEKGRFITTKLGNPPELCYPIYMISTKTNNEERIVYIGKTSSKISRFNGGHRALIKLLAPKYDNHQKKIYTCGIVLLSGDKEYLPLEWTKPLSLAESILKSIEAQLIHELQPELNTHHKKRYNVSHPLAIHIQNFSNTSKILHDKMIYPE